MTKVLSIIVPTYNMEKLLEADLQSLVEKTVLPLVEVVVVNDGSKDSSLAIARTFETAYPESFRVIDKPNGNYGSCINVGLKEATGKYVKILDADDMLLTDNYAELVILLSQIDVDIVISDYIKYYGKEDTENVRFGLPVGEVLDINPYYTDNAFASLQLPAITYRTGIFREIDYHQTEGISYTDMEWCFAPMSQVRKFYYFNKPVYQYLLSREGQTMDPAVQIRRFDQVLQSMTSILHTYSRIRKNAVSDEFLIGQIVRHLLYIYRFYLVDNKNVDRSALRIFDKEVAKYAPEAYATSGDFEYRPKIAYRYVESWRKGIDEFIPRKILIKEQILDFLGRTHVKLRTQFKSEVK